MKKFLLGLLLIGISFASFGAKQFSYSTSTTVNVTSLNTTILAANERRVYAHIYNVGAYPVYLSLGSTAVASKGIVLVTSANYELLSTKPYIGAISGISSVTDNVVYVVEGY